MPKIMLHGDEARRALGRGVAKLARAVRGTLGPRGMNAILDRPLGSPLVSRDGAAIAREVELEDPFENMGAQVAREVAKQTNELAGDGTTTATILAASLVEGGLAAIEEGASAVDLVAGLEAAAASIGEWLHRGARALRDGKEIQAVATIAANEERLGGLVAKALERIGPGGVLTVEEGSGLDTVLELVEGMTFDRGYLSHHMVTDIERMQAVLEEPDILMTDLKLQSEADLDAIERVIDDRRRSLLVIAEDVSPPAVARLMKRRDRGLPPVAAIHPPEYGHWRKAMLEDIAILTGGRVVARDLGGSLATLEPRDLGAARQVRIGADVTMITMGAGDPVTIEARRRQIARQIELAPPNVERDKLEMRLAKLSGGSAILYAGGATPAERRRRAQLAEDAVCAARAAVEVGIAAGGGTALLQAAPALAKLESELGADGRRGVALVRQALAQPLATIAANAGLDPDLVVARVSEAPSGTGLDARSGTFRDLFVAGVIDPAKVGIVALRNAASIAALILTTDTVIADRRDPEDPTAGPARGGGAERLGMG
jgi:chaperonin GroEL